jgi:Prephenate dehydrogenase
MNIHIIGLGLIGGSLAKAILKYCPAHSVSGFDTDGAICALALADDIEIKKNAAADVTFICLSPDRTIEYIKTCELSGIVADVCGVKSDIADTADGTALDFVPCHPMAGRPVGGYANADADLWQNASFIITPTDKTKADSIETIEKLMLAVGFSNIVKSSPADHDRIIAYTSQLAHIVSNCYLKSPTLAEVDGFTGGSFQDMTRVGNFDPALWAELFRCNKDNLSAELSRLIANLQEYSDKISEE